MTEEQQLSYLWCNACGERDEKHWSIIHWRIKLNLTTERCDRCGKPLAPDGPARVEVVNYSCRVFPVDSPALMRNLRADLQRHAELDQESWNYALKPKHSKALLAALDRADQLQGTIDEVKKGYERLDTNWHAVHESFTGAIRKALDLPDAPIHQLVARIEDLKAAEKVARLHVWHNDVDWVIAYDEDDAWRVSTAMTGIERDEYSEQWEQLPDDSELPVMLDTDTSDCPDIDGLPFEPLDGKNGFNVRVRTTCADWCKRAGRGMLCSTEF